MMVSAMRMERDFHRDQVAWVVECLITNKSPSKDGKSYHVDI